ncbi:hypothetical protein H2201_008372 [Coniosporium apollinis]|uniref:Uncharacterized protein n=1 Tax=Coniosporium apollinis TaxID=61459 RepID=A0ABQ9NGB7_9PEZI|nr:hypothetical protein H2201_008372 [Coniosporium apollinis]
MAALVIPDRFGMMQPQPGRPVPIQLGRVRQMFDVQTVAKVLPGLVEDLRYGRGVVDVRRYIHQSELVQTGEVSQREMREVWSCILASLNRQEGNARTNITLMDRLEECYRIDRQQNIASPSRYPQTLTFFLCLSEISQQVHSRCIGTIMSTFFSKHGEHISKTDPRCLLQWGEAIISSAMTEGEIMTCAREMISGRPSLLQEACNYQLEWTPNTELFLMVVTDLMARMEEGEFDWPDRGRGRWRRGAGLHSRRDNFYRFPRRPFRDDFDYPRGFRRPAFGVGLDDNYLFDEPRGFGDNYNLGGAVRREIEDLRDDVDDVRAEVKQIGREMALDRRVPRVFRNNGIYPGGLDDLDGLNFLGGPRLLHQAQF